MFVFSIFFYGLFFVGEWSSQVQSSPMSHPFFLHKKDMKTIFLSNLTAFFLIIGKRNPTEKINIISKQSYCYLVYKQVFNVPTKPSNKDEQTVDVISGILLA